MLTLMKRTKSERTNQVLPDSYIAHPDNKSKA